jgi:hypothetical protein
MGKKNICLVAFTGAILFSGLLLNASLLAKNGEKKSDELSLDEKKALHLQMIEYDISIRNIPSMISLQNFTRVEMYFGMLVNVKLLESPYYKESLQAALEKLKKKGTYSFYEMMQQESAAAIEALQGSTSGKVDVNMDKLYSSYRIIVDQCAGCHKEMNIRDQ